MRPGDCAIVLSISNSFFVNSMDFPFNVTFLVVRSINRSPASTIRFISGISAFPLLFKTAFTLALTSLMENGLGI